MKRYWSIVIGIAAAGLIVSIVIILLPNKPVISPSISQQLTFTPLIPGSPFVVDHSSVKYNAQLKVLSFQVSAFGKTVITSEQPTPDSFVDVPAAYQKVLQNMDDGQDFDDSIGTVHITFPPELNGKQAAVLSADGTLLFAKPSVNLSEDQWRRFFLTVEAVR